MKKSKRKFVDDGRVIANMDVDGMPWHMEKSPDAVDMPEGYEPYQMTKEEGRTYIWAAIKAGLLIVMVFGLIYFFFILFMDKVWFGN